MKITVTQLRNVIRQEVKRAINEGLGSDEDLGPDKYVPQGPDAADEAEALERRMDAKRWTPTRDEYEEAEEGEPEMDKVLDALMLATPSQISQIKKILKLKL